MTVQQGRPVVDAKPFVKWVGGKTQLLSVIQTFYPFHLGLPTRKYVEPFVGGGAVFFDILSHNGAEKSIINDINPNLINAYRTVKDNIDELVESLRAMEKEYLAGSPEERANFFYARRSDYNEVVTNPLDGNDVRRAALFLYLNKTCFNGLYRINRSGKFNSPHGRYKSPNISNEAVLRLAHQALQNTEILLGDYRATLPYVDESTFLYLDPPYRPLTASASFNAYDASVFDDTAQRELADFISQADARGAKIMLSNSDPKNADPDDSFFDDLYANHTIRRIPARRAISSKASTRGEINEIIVMNY